MEACWCQAVVKAMEEQARRGLLKVDYTRTTTVINGKEVLRHEWTVTPGGTQLYCWNSKR